MYTYKFFFLNYSNAAILSESHSGKILDLNDKALSLFNKSKEDFSNLKRSDIFPQKAIKEIDNQLKKFKKASVQSFILNSEGSKVEVDLNSELILENEKDYLLDVISLKEQKQDYPDLKPTINESEVKYKTLFESANDAIFLMKDHIIVDCNSKAMEMFSAKREYLLGKKPNELSPEFQPDGKKSFDEMIERDEKALKGISQYFEWQHIRSDGSFFDSEVSLKSINLGSETFVLAIVRDVTKRKQYEYELIQNENKFRSLVEESLVGVYVIQDGKFPYVNPKLADIFGYTTDEIISVRNIEDFIFEEDRNNVKENISRRVSGEIRSLNYSFRGIKKDKSIIQVEVMGSSTVYNGKPAVIGTLMDITEKSKTEKEIRKLSRGVEQSPASIIITDTEGNIEYANPKFTRLTGYTLQDVIGQNPRILNYGAMPSTYYERLWKTIKSGEEWHGEFLNKKKNGELFWEFASISPVKDAKGKIINFIAVKEDITDRKNIEEELKIAKEKAEEMNKLKSVFLANMSHELRTPMVAVLGYSEILKNEIENQNFREMANEIYDSSHRFMNTLNLILDLSRIESDKEIINLTEFDIVSIAVEEFNFSKQLAVRKNLLLKTNLPNETIVALFDERMFRQIISSLTSNAVKFTNKGSVSLSISKEYENNNKPYVIIKIIDTGIGIPMNNQSTIFEAFRQINEGLNRSFEGTGLGLTIAKKFVEMMNGTINVESEFEKGSTFIIKLPLIKRYDIQPVNMDSTQMKSELPENEFSNIPHILVVEDDQSNAGVIKFFLDSLYHIDMVLTGEEGIKKAALKKYAVVLMDIDLGTGISGLEAARKIRKIPGYEKIPIIAVTALAMRGDKEKFLAEGCTHYISKPFKKEELVSTIKDAVGQIG